MTPLTPSLAPATHAELEELLTQAGFPAVGHNSVVIAITQVLGLEPADRSYRYDEPYAHLPKISAQAQVVAAKCARVSADIEQQLADVQLRAHLAGTYCLVGNAKWESSDQDLARPDT